MKSKYAMELQIFYINIIYDENKIGVVTLKVTSWTRRRKKMH
jgi:hypothetical protein